MRRCPAPVLAVALRCAPRPDLQEHSRYTIGAAIDDRVMEVTEVRDVMDATPGRYIGPHILPAARRTAGHHGWGVLMPEDNLRLLMEDEGSGRTFIYVSLTDVGLWQRQREHYHGLFLSGTTLMHALHRLDPALMSSG